MTADRATCIAALVEANKALAAAHAAARRLGDVDLASYISDLAADTFSTMASVSNGREEVVQS